MIGGYRFKNSFKTKEAAEAWKGEIDALRERVEERADKLSKKERRIAAYALEIYEEWVKKGDDGKPAASLVEFLSQGVANAPSKWVESGPTVREAWEVFFAERSTSAGAAYLRQLSPVRNFANGPEGDMELRRVRPEALADWIVENYPESVERVRSVFVTFFNFAKEKGMIPTLAMTAVEETKKEIDSRISATGKAASDILKRL